MKILLVRHDRVLSLLPMSECIEVMKEAFRTLVGGGGALQPIRQVLMIPDSGGALAAMPAYLNSPRAAGVKVITVFSGNVGTRFESHQGAVLLFECENGRLLAIMDASPITAIRTAAVSAAATEVLARKDARDLAILGSGTQAMMHLEAMQKVRAINGARVWSPNADHSRRFATIESRKWNLPIRAVGTAREAVRDADIICTVTSASSPILLGEWLEPGVHINAVGVSRPPNRELDSDAVMRSELFVDRRESALKEAEDILAPKREGKIDDNHILGELGELLVGRVQGRTSEADITVFKSVGLALEDLASAYHIYSKAKTKKIGTWVEFGGERSV